MQYRIADVIAKQAAHHESIEALWNLVWKKRVSMPCAKALYATANFRSVLLVSIHLWKQSSRTLKASLPSLFRYVVQHSADTNTLLSWLHEQVNLRPPYDFDRYCEAFWPMAVDLSRRGTEAEELGDFSAACQLYLRSSAVYRISRFPTPQSPKQKIAWELQKNVFLKGARFVFYM
jgi:hypothetical protein